MPFYHGYELVWYRLAWVWLYCKPPSHAAVIQISVIAFQAHRVYEQGASLGLFRSAWQRSLYNVNRLKSWPWWTMEQTQSAAKHFKVRSASSLDVHLHQLPLIQCNFPVPSTRLPSLTSFLLLLLSEKDMVSSRMCGDWRGRVMGNLLTWVHLEGRKAVQLACVRMCVSLQYTSLAWWHNVKLSDLHLHCCVFNSQPECCCIKAFSKFLAPGYLCYQAVYFGIIGKSWEVIIIIIIIIVAAMFMVLSLWQKSLFEFIWWM